MKITLERGRKKYEVVVSRDCSKRCSFKRQHKGQEPCEESCYLPKWFLHMLPKLAEAAYLVEIK